MGFGGEGEEFFWLTVENTVEKNYDINVTAAGDVLELKTFLIIVSH